MIKDLYGLNGGFDRSYNLGAGPWARILTSISRFQKRGVVVDSLIKRKIGNGIDTKFWKDKRHGDILENIFPRLFELELDKECYVVDIRSNGVWS